LFKNITKFNTNVSYLETAYTLDSQDIENIRRRVKAFDTIIITNFYIRGKLSNNEMVRELCKDKAKKVILVTNTPYEVLSIPAEADTVIVTFATSPDNIEATAGVIFGGIRAEGEWPIELKICE
jgi:NDP-sugar pyrophosphorylase family protein